MEIKYSVWNCNLLEFLRVKYAVQMLLTLRKKEKKKETEYFITTLCNINSMCFQKLYLSRLIE